ncbi:hypothetical protein RTP6_006570 [Batrachochytrium dendrobatidis]
MAAHGFFKPSPDSFHSLISIHDRITTANRILDLMEHSLVFQAFHSSCNTGLYIHSPYLQDIYTHMIELYSRSKNMLACENIRDRMRILGLNHSTVPIISHLVYGYSLSGNKELASIHACRLQQLTGPDSPRPYYFIMRAHFNHAYSIQLVQTYHDMQSKGIRPDSHVLGILCNYFAKQGELTKFWQHYHMYQKLNIPKHISIYNLALAIQNQNGDYLKTETLFKKMVAKGIAINRPTFDERFIAWVGSRKRTLIWREYAHMLSNGILRKKSNLSFCKYLGKIKSVPHIQYFIEQATANQINVLDFLPALVSGYAGLGDVISTRRLIIYANRYLTTNKVSMHGHEWVLKAYCIAMDLDGATKYLTRSGIELKMFDLASLYLLFKLAVEQCGPTSSKVESVAGMIQSVYKHVSLDKLLQEYKITKC